MSRGFLSSLFGVAMTLLGWYGPWAWPSWPAYAVISATIGTQSNLADLDSGARAAFLVLLIIVNVGVWAAVAAFALSMTRQIVSHKDSDHARR